METTIGIIGQAINELRLERRLALEVINSTKLVRAEERETFRFEGSPITYSVLFTSFPDRVMGALLETIEPYDGSLPAYQWLSHPGEEFVYLLEGTFRIWLEDKCYDLLPGDCIHYMATATHHWENPGRKGGIAISLITPPVF